MPRLTPALARSPSTLALLVTRQEECGIPLWPDDLADLEAGESEAQQRLDLSGRLRAAGNELYKDEKYEQAALKYTHALR